MGDHRGDRGFRCRPLGYFLDGDFRGLTCPDGHGQPHFQYSARSLELTCPIYQCLCELDTCHVTEYTLIVIKTFANRYTRDLYLEGKSKRFPPEIIKRAIRKLEYVDLATGLEDLKVPPSNQFHELERERKGQFTIRVNDQWRICFRFVDGDAFDVELTDYH
jgi:proteic killer suppression protein